MVLMFFYFNETPTTEIYTLSLHDALPICGSLAVDRGSISGALALRRSVVLSSAHKYAEGDRKSTRLNSSHQIISYAVFCLKKKKKILIFSFYFSRVEHYQQK